MQRVREQAQRVRHILEAHQAGAMVVADFLMSPEAQAQKQDPAVWGDFTVLDVAALEPADRERFDRLARGVAQFGGRQGLRRRRRSDFGEFCAAFAGCRSGRHFGINPT